MIIPERFTTLQRWMLATLQEDFRPNPRYAGDDAIYILDLFCSDFILPGIYSEREMPRMHFIIITAFFGITTGLFEVTQACLPERSSQLTDVIMNSGGTALDVYLWRRYAYPHHQLTSK